MQGRHAVSTPTSPRLLELPVSSHRFSDCRISAYLRRNSDMLLHPTSSCFLGHDMERIHTTAIPPTLCSKPTALTKMIYFCPEPCSNSRLELSGTLQQPALSLHIPKGPVTPTRLKRTLKLALGSPRSPFSLSCGELLPARGACSLQKLKQRIIGLSATRILWY